jgi:hypothetical protein
VTNQALLPLPKLLLLSRLKYIGQPVRDFQNFGPAGNGGSTEGHRRCHVGEMPLWLQDGAPSIRARRKHVFVSITYTPLANPQNGHKCIIGRRAIFTTGRALDVDSSNDNFKTSDFPLPAKEIEGNLGRNTSMVLAWRT